MTHERFSIDVLLPPDHRRAAMAADAEAGLTASPKTLPPVWFYDEHGSELFDEITRLPEYYPTRAERAILTAHAAEIVRSRARRRVGRARLGNVGQDPAAPRRDGGCGTVAALRPVRRERGDVAARGGGYHRRVRRPRARDRRRLPPAPGLDPARRTADRRVPRQHDREPDARGTPAVLLRSRRHPRLRRLVVARHRPREGPGAPRRRVRRCCRRDRGVQPQRPRGAEPRARRALRPRRVRTRRAVERRPSSGSRCGCDRATSR